MKEHNFIELKEHKYKIRPGMTYWICKQCDTIVVYSSILSQRAVNRAMANRMICAEPVPEYGVN